MADRPGRGRPERRIGIDTNVLIDPVQKKPGRRKQVAEEVVEALYGNGAILPTKAISEFFNGTTKGSESLLGRADARGRVMDLMKNFEIVQVTKADVAEATKLACKHGSLKVYDAQMLVVFSREGCRYFLTGDKAVAKLGSYKGMEIVNPHEEGFDLNALLDSCWKDVPAAPPQGDPLPPGPPAPAGPGAAVVPEVPGVADGPGDDGVPEVDYVPRNELAYKDVSALELMLDGLEAASGKRFTLRIRGSTIEAVLSERKAQGDA